MIIIRKPTTFQLQEVDCETVIGVSVTVPDQSLTITEIFEQYATGVPMPELIPVYYGEEDYYPNPQTLDLTEKEDLLLSIGQAKQAHYDELEKHDKESKKLAFEKSLEQEIEKRKAKSTQKPDDPA